jgi:pimeloyl-ACP methyl ester carboxylesterase
LADLLDHLGIQKAIVVGFSLGGLIGQNFAIHNPERVLGLVVVASVCCRLPAEQNAVEVRCETVRNAGPPAVVDETIQRWFTKEFQSRHPDVVRNWREKILGNDPESYKRAYQLYRVADADFREDLHRINAPTLIVTGDRDAGQTPRMAQEMARRIPNSQVEITPGVAHMYPIEAADALIALIMRFAEMHAA